MKKCGSRYLTGKQRGVCNNIIQIRYKEGDDKNDVGVEEGTRTHFIWGTFLEEVMFHLSLD